MKKILIGLVTLTFCGCTYAVSPYPMKPDMVNKFEGNSSVKFVNKSTNEEIPMDNMVEKVNYKEATDSTILLLAEEFSKNGVKNISTSDKIINLKLDSIYIGNYGVAIGCTMTYSLETNSGITKKYKEQNTSGFGYRPACNFAVTKVVASIINDDEIRNFIISK